MKKFFGLFVVMFFLFCLDVKAVDYTYRVKVLYNGVNLRKKHLKPKNNGGTGEIVEVEAPIHASNVMLLDPKTKKPTRVKIERDEKGKKIRISKKSNQKID